MHLLSPILSVAAALIVAGPCGLTLVFAIEVGCGLKRLRAAPPGVLPRDVAIVMPAHDEAAIIGPSVAALTAELGAPFRLLLVADNCDDDTAARARAAGATVIERHDPGRRGKGFALALACDELRRSPPESVIVVDADCHLTRASFEQLAAATATGRPAQANYLLRPDLDAPPQVQVSNFAFVMKNLVRQRGLYRLAGRVNLTGTGMAFPWRLFADAPLATDDIVEDLGLGLDLARAGHPPMFVEGATVWSAASSAEGTLRQRARWEGGFLATSFRRAPRAFLAGLRAGRPRELWAALSLAVPPVTLLAMIDLAAAALAGALVAAGASAIPAAVALACGALAALVTILAWFRYGRAFLSGAAVLRAPLYVIWKLPLYLGFLRRRPREWLRAGR